MRISDWSSDVCSSDLAGYIGDSNPTQLVADCVATLKAGHSLMIFPEGTRSRPGQPLQAPHGTARIALESGAPVLPVTIRRSEEHTSELQSLMRNSYAVFCVKKKKRTTIHKNLNFTIISVKQK